ncbi:MAG TPA: hypothetical protein VNL77_24170 [Roseiflexaceae bacterium]|nr:hypothetical protein [Roseiflexaceae bacterium]
MGRRIGIAVAIGAAAAALCYVRLLQHGDYAADFTLPLFGARWLLAGQNPYTSPYPVDSPLFYPLPAVLAALPFAPLPPELAGALFFGLSSGLLAFGLTRDGWHRLLLFLSAPFLMALAWAQWPPLIMAAVLLPGLYPLAICKPNLGLPLMLAYPSWRGMAACAALLLLSLLVLPSWPLDWLASLGRNRHAPPLVVLPGPLLLLGLLRWRAPEARLLLLLALAPQRLFFSDQLPLWLIPATARQTLALTLASWLGFFAWLAFDSGTSAGAPPWVVACTYLPALALVLLPLAARRAARPARLPE